MKSHYTIPFFLIHKGCPFKCVFCDQEDITGQDMVAPGDVEGTIEEYLSTIPDEAEGVEVGFFGGTFTGLDLHQQEEYLKPVQKFLAEGRVAGIRISTRPDLIDDATLEFLKKYGVTCIELGVQSMSDKVLAASKRGHTARDVERASKMVLDKGFKLGHQMMLGLPESTWEDELVTAKKAVEMGATGVRIYPALVMKNTALAKAWHEGKYKPLTEEEAVKRAAQLIMYFKSHKVKVIRCGLHPSEGLIDGSSYLAGPFHPAFRQKAESCIFGLKLKELTGKRSVIKSILINPADEGAFFGHDGCNRSLIESFTQDVVIGRDAEIPRGEMKVLQK